MSVMHLKADPALVPPLCRFLRLSTFGKFYAVVVALTIIATTHRPLTLVAMDVRPPGRYLKGISRGVWNTSEAIIYTIWACARRSYLVFVLTNLVAVVATALRYGLPFWLINISSATAATSISGRAQIRGRTHLQQLHLLQRSSPAVQVPFTVHIHSSIVRLVGVVRIGRDNFAGFI